MLISSAHLLLINSRLPNTHTVKYSNTMRVPIAGEKSRPIKKGTHQSPPRCCGGSNSSSSSSFSAIQHLCFSLAFRLFYGFSWESFFSADDDDDDDDGEDDKKETLQSTNAKTRASKQALTTVVNQMGDTRCGCVCVQQYQDTAHIWSHHFWGAKKQWLKNSQQQWESRRMVFGEEDAIAQMLFNCSPPHTDTVAAVVDVARRQWSAASAAASVQQLLVLLVSIVEW